MMDHVHVPEHKKIPKFHVFVSALLLLGVTLSLEWILCKSNTVLDRNRGRRRCLHGLERWIVHGSLAIYLLATGYLSHGLLVHVRRQWVSYFVNQRGIPEWIKNCRDIFVGFALPWLSLPLWLSVREGTIDCLGNRSCVNAFSNDFLPFVDLVCFTPHFGQSGQGLGPCEALGYTLPLMLLTSIPLLLTLALQKVYLRGQRSTT